MNRRESLRLLAGTAAFASLPFAARVAMAQAPAAPDGPFKLPPLGYANDALEPHIDAQTMMIHHDRHHAAFVNVLNQVAKDVPALGTTPIEQTLADPAYIPVQLQQQVKNNLGGHWNHTFFWELMKPGGAKEPGTELKSAIEGSWKDVNEFKDRVNAAGVGRFGFGLGVAGGQQGQEAGADLHGEPGHRRFRSAPRPSSASMCGSTPIT